MSTAFETEMGVLPEISRAVDEMEWSLPTDIQSDAIPLILGGGDVLMAAETGSGKTGAFCLPVLQIVYETLSEKPSDKKTDTSISDNKWKMNVYDCTPALAIDTESMLCQSRDIKGWHGCRATKGVTGTGKYYFECTVTDDGLCRVGWSTIEANLDLGTCDNGFGFGGTGKKSNKKQFTTYGHSFTKGDTLGNCLDLDNQTIRWYKNDEDLGHAFNIPPNMRQSVFYPAVCMKNAELRFNFGELPMISLPKGYTAVCDAKPECIVSSKFTSDRNAAAPSVKRKGPFAIIIEPSRELAEQTFKQLQLFKKYLVPCPRVSLLVGGMDTRVQQNELAQVVDIVVGTPGRLQDLIAGKLLHLDSVRFFVLDECDGLVSQGNRALIDEIHKQLPRVSGNGYRLQMIVCSATLHSFEVKRLADALMHFPQWVDLKGADSVPETVHHVVCVVDPRQDRSWQTQESASSRMAQGDGVHDQDHLSVAVESPEMLSEAVKILKPGYVVQAIRALGIDRAFIFCRTKLDCDNLERMFIKLGGGPNKRDHQFSCVCLHSDRAPNERRSNLEKFKRGDVRMLICTDVASRGLDVKGLPYVINVTLPDEKENYVHRIGRVGRAERMGLAVSLVAAIKEKVWYHANCETRGKGCSNTKLVPKGGCCIWYDEKKILGEVEEHLGVTIDQVANDFKLETNTFDGKVVYGQKRQTKHVADNSRRDELAPAVRELAKMEKLCESNYLKLFFGI